MVVQTPSTVPYEAFQRERERRIAAEQERDSYKNELFILRKIRRAPALKPVTSAILEEFRHVEKWGQVKDPSGNSRANYTTIAKNLNISADTVARNAERLEKLQLVDLHEHQGPQDESERIYVHVREEKVATIDKLKDTEQVIPQQGGNRYICTKCGSTRVSKRVVTYLKCLNPECSEFGHESLIDDTGYIEQNKPKSQKQVASNRFAAFETPTEEAKPETDDCDNKEQNGQKTQKQLAFDAQECDQALPEKQVANHSVDTLPSLPVELQSCSQWVCWRYGKKNKQGKLTKVPYNVRPDSTPTWKASTTNPETWTDYGQAQKQYAASQSWKSPYNGIGFVFNNDFTGIDLDKCIDDQGNISDLALARIAALNSYTEPSPSGTGVHIIAFGTVPTGVKRDDIEMYSQGRFFTFTGRQLPGMPTTIEKRQAEIDSLYAEIAPTRPALTIPQASIPCLLSDQDVLDKARNAKNGAKFTALWQGDASLWEGQNAVYGSQSEADLALCRMLAFSTKGNVSTIDRLFRLSGLYRADKWDRKARTGETYGTGTIQRALCGQGQVAADIHLVQPVEEIASVVVDTSNMSELEALASELGAEIAEPCNTCGCMLQWDRQGEMYCCRCYPKPRNNWSDEAWRRLRALPGKRLEACG